MKNIWKLLFFILLGLNVFALVLFSFLIISGKKYDDNISEENQDQSKESVQILVNNDIVEKVINEQIEDDTMKVTIDEKEILVHVDYTVFNFDVPITISIEPLVKEDQIILKLEDIDVGQLPIDSDFLYNNLKDYVPLDKGMEFSENNRAIIIDSELFSDELDYDVQIDKIDYKNDRWYFSIKNLF